jgi:hypothetical protein
MYEHMRNLYYGPSRDYCAWITARCAHCQTQKIQKGKGPVKPILSEYPGQRIVLDLMDFRVSAKVICLALFLSHVLLPNSVIKYPLYNEWIWYSFWAISAKWLKIDILVITPDFSSV